MLKFALKNMAIKRVQVILILLSIVISAGIGVLAFNVANQVDEGITNNAAYYSVIVGPAGSNTQLAMNSMYFTDSPVGTIPYSVVSALQQDSRVTSAIPFAMADNYNGYGVVGTTPAYLAGKTVGIIGVGQIGSKVARRLKAFDSKIICYDPYCCNTNTEFDFVDLDTLLKQSDFITIHMRLTESTKHMLGKRELALMKPTAYVINTARSGLIDEAALVEALQNKQIMGAALDVFEEEPLTSGNPLLALKNVTLTPHMAGASRDAFWGAPALLAQKIEKALQA